MKSLIIARHQIRRTIGNRKALITLVLLPILIISGIVGLFGRASGEHIPVALLNADGGWLSEQIAASIRSDETYDLVEQDAASSDPEQLKSKVYDGEWGRLSTFLPASPTS